MDRFERSIHFFRTQAKPSRERETHHCLLCVLCWENSEDVSPMIRTHGITNISGCRVACQIVCVVTGPASTGVVQTVMFWGVRLPSGFFLSLRREPGNLIVGLRKSVSRSAYR